VSEMLRIVSNGDFIVSYCIVLLLQCSGDFPLAKKALQNQQVGFWSKNSEGRHIFCVNEEL